MAVVVLVVLVGLLVLGAGVAFAVALARSGQADHAAQLEILPGVDTGAPPAWAGAHTPEAKLHRRLGAAMRGLRAQAGAVDEGLHAMELRIELEQHALATDRRLVAAAALPPGSRGQAIAEVEVSVAAIEQAAADLARSAQAGGSADVRGLEDLAARIRGLRGEDEGPDEGGQALGGTA